MTLDTKLALLSAIVQAIVIGLLVYRRLYRKLPLFFSYLIWLLLFAGATVEIANIFQAQPLQKIFVIAEIIDAVFMFCRCSALSGRNCQPGLCTESQGSWPLRY